jgi:hypothetical protein
VTAVFCYFYGWHTFASVTADAATTENSATSYLKTASIAVYLYSICRFGIGRTSWLLFSGLIAIMLIDGGRTSFFPAIVLTLMFWQSGYGIKTRNIIFFFIGAVILMQLVRGFLIKNSGLDLILGPFVSEGFMSSYSTRQSIYAVLHMSDPPFQFGVGSFEKWAHDIDPYTPGEFAPMGGVYFIGEAVANFGYAGPAIFAFVFGCVLTFLEQWKRRKKFLYVAFNGTIGVLFAKTSLMGEMKVPVAPRPSIHRSPQGLGNSSRQMCLRAVELKRLGWRMA